MTKIAFYIDLSNPKVQTRINMEDESTKESTGSE